MDRLSWLAAAQIENWILHKYEFPLGLMIRTVAGMEEIVSGSLFLERRNVDTSTLYLEHGQPCDRTGAGA